MAGVLRITLLGRVTIAWDDRPLSELTSLRAQALLIYLAVTGQPHSRSRLAGLLWPDVLEASARSSLRVTLMRLRAAVGDHVVSAPQTLSLNLDLPLWLDVREFEGLCLRHQVRTERLTDQDRQQLRQAVRLYDDDFLTDFNVPDAPLYEEWVVQQRAYYRRLVLEALHRLIADTPHEVNAAELASDARRLASLDPLDEGAHRCLMRCYAQQGQTTLALRQYEECRHRLMAELGVEPSEETSQLFQEIRRGKFPAVSQPDAIREKRLEQNPLGLPPAVERTSPGHVAGQTVSHHTSPFVGRQQELAQIRQRLADPDVGLLTIVGLGGIGKTRLAVEAARQLQDWFADGVWFVPLASLDRADLVSSTISNLLNLTGYSGSDPEGHLLRHLADKQLLLVLDNLEHLPDAADLVGHILASAPEVRILATSRARLNLHEEWLLPLVGLDIPAPGENPAGDPSAHSAVKLFVQRARRLQPDFVDDSTNLAHILEVCRLVGGMPLAIELAATWVRTIPLSQLCAEVQAGLNFLATSERNVPDRHRSMHAVFDRSWRLLDEPDRNVLARLGVFRGGFTREAAEKVAGATLHTLAHLIDASWLHRSADGRYSLHELVRQYAADQLRAAPGREDAVQRAHARFFGTWAAQESADLGTMHQKGAVDRLMAEIDNIRVGWECAVAKLDVELIGRYAEALRWLADTRSLYREIVPEFAKASAALRQILSDTSIPRADRQEATYILGILLHIRAWLGTRAISVVEALPLAAESLDLLRNDDVEVMDERRRRAYLDALAFTSFVALMGGDYDQAVARSTELTRLVKGRSRYSAYAGLANQLQAYLAHFQGRFEEARRLYEQNIAHSGGADSSILAYNPQMMLAKLYLDVGHLDRASDFIADATRAMEQVGFWTANPDILHTQARIAMQRGDLDRAKEYLAEVGKIAEKTGIHYTQTLNLLGQAQLARLSSAPSDAQQYYREAVELTGRVGRRHKHEQALVGLGFATLDLGEFGAAWQHFQRALRAAWEIGLMPEASAAVAGMALAKLQADSEGSEPSHWLSVAMSHPACLKETKDEVEKFLAQVNLPGVAQNVLAGHPEPEPALEQIIARLLVKNVPGHE